MLPDVPVSTFRLIPAAQGKPGELVVIERHGRVRQYRVGEDSGFTEFSGELTLENADRMLVNLSSASGGGEVVLDDGFTVCPAANVFLSATYVLIVSSLKYTKNTRLVGIFRKVLNNVDSCKNLILKCQPLLKAALWYPCRVKRSDFIKNLL